MGLRTLTDDNRVDRLVRSKRFQEKVKRELIKKNLQGDRGLDALIVNHFKEARRFAQDSL